MAAQMQIKVVIFDLGGVLLRTDDPQPRTSLAKRLGVTRAELEEIVFMNKIAQQAEIGRATPEEVWGEVARLLNRPVQEMPAIEQDFFGGDQVDFELIHLIQSLRATYTTALLSNTWVVDLPGFLSEKLHIANTFDVIVSSAQQGVQKPNAKIYQILLDLVQARPEEAVFVDDAARNIAGAAALGIHTVHFRNADQARRELTSLLGLADHIE